jgi:hypothetical protein
LPLALSGCGFRVFANADALVQSENRSSAPSRGLASPSETTHVSSGHRAAGSRRNRRSPMTASHEVRALLTFSPHRAAACVDRGCLSRPACASRFSQPPGAFNPPCACRPCFMPDPPSGFTLQSLAPPAQPYAVSGAAPLLTFLTSTGEPTTAPGCSRNRAKGLAKREPRGAPRTSRVWHRARVRYRETVV